MEELHKVLGKEQIEKSRVVLFIIGILLCPFVSFFSAIDTNYYSSWFLISMTLILIPIHLVNISTFFVSVFLLLIPTVCFGNLDLNSVLPLLVSCYLFSSDLKEFIGCNVSLVRNILRGYLSIIVIYVGGVYFSNIGFTHEQSYDLIKITAHRNLLFEHLAAVIIVLVIFGAIWLDFLLVVLCFLMALLFGSKAAYLSIFLVGIYGIHKYFSGRLIIYTFSCGLIFLISFNIVQLVRVRNYPNKYYEWHKDSSRLMKDIDFVYQYQTSSIKDRVEIWRRTPKLSLLGHGLGSWRLDTFCLNNDKVDSEMIDRRPHNELIRIVYEFGILSVFVLLFFFANSKLLLFLPIFLFSFPMERADYCILFIAVSFADKLRVKKKLMNIGFEFSNSNLGIFVKRYVLFLIISIGIAMSRSSYVQFELWSRSKQFHQISNFDRSLIETFKYDFLMNRYETYILMDPKISNEYKLMVLDRLKVELPSYYYMLIKRIELQKD